MTSERRHRQPRSTKCLFFFFSFHTDGHCVPMAWDSQMHFLAENGFRVVAHDRRGHGRSSQAWSGNDMNGYADVCVGRARCRMSARSDRY
jgi:pimeloyl-ACP methyl ester carboxylesterase